MPYVLNAVHSIVNLKLSLYNLRLDKLSQKGHKNKQQYH